MKVLLISNMYPSIQNPFYGVFVKKIEDGLVKNGIEIIDRIVISRKPNSILQKGWSYITFYFHSIYRLLFGARPDAIYVHFVLHSSIPLLILKRLIKSKIILNVHGTDVSSTNPILKKIIRKSLNMSDLIVVPSTFYKHLLEERFAIKSSKIFVSPSGGVNMRVFRPGENKERMNDVFTIGYISRVDSEKGWDVYLKAIRSLKDRYPDMKIKGVMIGSGGQQNQLIEAIDQLKLNEVVTFLGSRLQMELPHYLNQMDVFIFPSLRESLGLVGVEAMACGVPVIGSDIGGIREYLINGYNGLSFIPGNSESLFSQLEHFTSLSNDEKMKYRSNALTTVNKFNSDDVAKSLSECFEGLI